MFKHSLVSAALALLFSVLTTSAFAWNSGANCPAGQYDILGWSTPQSGYSSVHQQGTFQGGAFAGQTSYDYTIITPTSSTTGVRYHIKNPTGYPWDIDLYDANYIYFWLTSLSFTDVNKYHDFPNQPPWSNTNQIMAPRCAPAGYPGWTHTNPAQTQYVSAGGPGSGTTGGCALTASTWPVSYVQTWGPYTNINWGGSIPNGSPTMVLSYVEYYGAAWHNERYYYVEGYGWVWWNEFLDDGAGGWTWINGTSMVNQVSGGAPAYVNNCSPN